MNKRHPNDSDEEQKRITRRQFIKHSAVVMAGAAAVQTGLASVVPTSAVFAAPAAVNTAGITATVLSGPTPAYVARPTTGGVFPAVMLLHDWKGITAEVQNAAQRLAQGGLLSYAPDLRRPDSANVDRLQLAIDTMILEQNGYIQAGMLGLVALGSSDALAFALAQSYNRIGATVILYDGDASQNSMLPSRFRSTHPAGYGPLILRTFEPETSPAARTAAIEESWQKAIRWLNTNLTA